MLLSHLLVNLPWALGATLATGSARESEAEVTTLIERDSSTAVLERRTQVLQNSTSISKSWQNALLYRHIPAGLQDGPLGADVSITCKSCYATAKISTSLTYSDRFDATRAIEDVTNGVKPVAKSLTQNGVGFIQSSFQGMGSSMMQDIQNVAAGRLGLELLPYPTLPFDFNLGVSSIPNITVRCQIDGLDVFAQLETSLSKGATYRINLFTSKTRSTFMVSKSLFLDLSAALDLIIDAPAALSMASGFHIKLSDGFLMESKLFATSPPQVTSNGSQFEFMPVSITTDGAEMSATLQLRVDTGFTYDTANLTVFNQTFSFSAGIESSMVANVATFSTNVTRGGKNCDLQAVEAYHLGVGAAAGANMRAGTQTWGSTPNTTTGIASTTLDAVCATKISQGATTTTSAGSNRVRQALIPTTISTTQIFVGQACVSSGLVDCPVSLQTTTTFPAVLTISTEVPSGVTPTLPQTTLNSVVATSKFGTQMRSIAPSPTASTSAGETVLGGSTGGVSNKVIIGVAVGLGVPFLLALITIAVMYYRSRRAGLRRRLPENLSLASSSPSRQGQKESRTIFDYSSDPLPFGAYGHKAANVTVSVERNYA
ncbi:hypothetical protein GQ53DRAFT_835388 [Thozetella sp. PMI_491]|nr:hypothetical protein GQ53DRAFT_835388 [Thozetella sp. PMI_491]